MSRADRDPDHAQVLRARLTEPRIVVVPGCYDALSASLIQHSGFDAAYLSGASIAYTRLGQPDIGLVSMHEVAQTVSAIRERVTLPVLVDADTGFGNALNMQRTVKLFERAGASALQIEDQQFPKRCGHLAGKAVVPAEEMIGKIRAACDARNDADTVIIARTDAVAVEGIDAAFERVARYLEAGADVLFMEALPDVPAMQRFTREFGERLPLLANMVEGGRTPLLSAAELQQMGYSIAIFPGAMVRVQTFAALHYLRTLARDGTTRALRDEMLDFDELNELLETRRWLQHGERYAGKRD
ncbi:MAG: isocitrate lyase/phosphoenolpyruvate mutase family protein [Pseudomonadota bacterium]